MPTGPHELEYRKFEGVIPSGEYGAGPVMIWDRGRYNPELEVEKGVREEIFAKRRADEVAAESFGKGNLKFRLYGTKLKGSFALVRTYGLGGKEAWLMIKHRDGYSVPGYDAKEYDFSAVTKRSIDEIAMDGDASEGSFRQKKLWP